MAVLKRSLRRKNATGNYDTIRLESDSSIVYRPSGRTVEQDLAAYLPSTQSSDVVPKTLSFGKLLTGVSKAWIGNSSNVPIELSNPDSSGTNTFVNGDILLKPSDKQYKDWYKCDGITETPTFGSVSSSFQLTSAKIISTTAANILDTVYNNYGINPSYKELNTMILVNDYLYVISDCNISPKKLISKFRIGSTLSHISTKPTMYISSGSDDYMYSNLIISPDAKFAYGAYSKRWSSSGTGITKIDLNTLNYTDISLSEVIAGDDRPIIGRNKNGDVIFGFTDDSLDDTYVFDVSGKKIGTISGKNSYVNGIYQGTNGNFYNVQEREEPPYSIDNKIYVKYNNDFCQMVNDTNINEKLNIIPIYCTSFNGITKFKSTQQTFMLNKTQMLYGESPDTVRTISNIPNIDVSKNSPNVNRSNFIMSTVYNSDESKYTIDIYHISKLYFKDKTPKTNSPISGYEYYLYAK